MLIIGIDEAGYGPNLGPLVVSGSCWSLSRKRIRAARSPEAELETRLRDGGIVSDAPEECRNGKSLLCVADSKKLYTSGRSLEPLQTPVLHFLRTRNAESTPRRRKRGGKISSTTPELFDALPWTWRGVFRTLAPQSWPEMADLPWHRGYDKKLCVPDAGTTRRLKIALQAAKLDAPRLASTVVFPRRFNETLEMHDSKATAHLCFVLDFARTLVYDEISSENFPATVSQRSDVLVLCDKLGARNRYADFLKQFFFADDLEILRESDEQSVYLLRCGVLRLEMRFCVRGERFLPVALASMTAKYLRELAMAAWNEFWCEKIEGLEPTAGYPVDAKRFRSEIEPLRIALGIEEIDFWRRK